MSVPDWPVAFFDDEYLERYRPFLDSEQSEREALFIAAALEVERGARVLDLGCGVGRHAVPMARRGFQVTGLDFNPRYLAGAEGAAREAGLSARWVAGDMRAMGFEREFDGVYSWFTSFGYFTDEENERVVAGVAAALVAGGRFLIDVVNRDWLLLHRQHRTWTQRDDGTLLMEEVTLDLPNSRVRTRQTLIEAGGTPRAAKSFDLRAYTCGELSALLRRHGLERERIWGGADGSEYSENSRRLVLLARRTDAR